MMTDIPQALKHLTAAVRADPLLSLAYAVAWLDPLWRANLNDFYDDGDSVHLALCILRGAFPDIYAQAVERLRIGTTGAALDHFISSAITARGIPLESISMLDYGIPLPAYGISLDELDDDLKSPALALVLRLFGITLDRESTHVIVPDGVYTVAQALSDSLLQQTDERLQQVGWGLAWVFSCSGNTLVDSDNDSLWELEPLSWEAEDVAFAIELIQEAERIMQAVDEGLHTLNTQPRLQQALSDNLQSLYRKSHKKGLLMDITSDWNGRLLAQVLSEAPSLTLSFYSYGILLRKQEGDRVSEYPVDAEQIALALSAKVRFDTGLLSDDTLLVRQEGAQRLVIAYRAPCKTGLFLEGSEHPLHVPLPALVLLRTVSDGQQPQYALYAVKNRPTTLQEPLFHAPLPNVFNSGSICWGTVPRASDAGLTGTSLAQDWDLLLGSRFGDHAANGKSKRYPSDIRKMWTTLEARHARTYPKSDLLPVNKTLGQVIGEARA